MLFAPAAGQLQHDTAKLSQVADVALTRNNSRPSQRQIDLTTAVCQERLLATHVRHVLALVDLVSDQLAFDSAVDIYVRVLRLNPEQARNVASRALAALGERGVVPAQHGVAPIAESDEDLSDASADEGVRGRSQQTFARFRRRIRGRVQEDLRHRINLAAARAEDTLISAHVANALTFVKTFDEMGTSEAAELYLETMSVQEGVADVIYNRALRTIADDALPPVEGDGVGARAE